MALPRHRSLVVGLLLLGFLSLTGCGGGGGGGGDAEPTYTLSGQVTLNGAGFPGAEVALSGEGRSLSATTDAAGAYSFSGLLDGAYTVIPTVTGQTLSPANLSRTISGADSSANDFALVTYEVSGMVTINGNGCQGATVTLSGAAEDTATTSFWGTFAFTGLLNGSYTVTPTMTGQTFTPSLAAVAVSHADTSAGSFALDTHDISGQITCLGNGYAHGGTVMLTGDTELVVNLDGSGNYSFAGLPNGSYTVAPAVTGQTLSPASAPVTVSGADETGHDFSIVTYVVSGKVRLGSAPFPGAVVSLSGAATATTLTNAAGDFTFQLPNGTYSITPGVEGQSVAPATMTFTVAGSSQFGKYFYLVTHTVSGTVTMNGATLPGVAVSLTGDAALSAATDATGAFSFPGLLNGSYTVTPRRDGQSFTPASSAVPVSYADASAGSFALDTHDISGSVTWLGNGYSHGGTVMLTGDTDLLVNLDPLGSYSFIGLPNGSYTVTPAVTGQSLSPLSAPVTLAGAGTAGVDFALDTYSISGSVTLRGDGWAGVEVSRTGEGTVLASTDASGGYLFSGLLNGGYLVAPTMASPDFTPASRWVSVSSASAAGQDFAALAVEPVSFDLLPGTYLTTRSVTLSTATPDATIRYTTDGSAPSDTHGTVYSTPVTVSSPVILRASASREGYLSPPVKSRHYAITPFVASAEHANTVVVRRDGTVWAWGRPDDGTGYLGDGSSFNRPKPVWIAGLTEIVTVATGLTHTVALRSDGTVWVWGENPLGELGNGTTGGVALRPVQVAGLTGVVAIAAGEHHTLALKDDGTVWGWGNNAGGQLGGTTQPYTTPVQVAGLSGVVAIEAGGWSSHALLEDGTVWSLGQNGNGQLGDGTTTDRRSPVQASGLAGVVALRAGQVHVLALLEDGSVRSWGYNYRGQLGDGTNSTRLTPVPVPGLSGVVSLGAGVANSYALLGDGSMWGWGYNQWNQLADGSTSDRWSPVAATDISGLCFATGGVYHTVAVKADGTLWSWGANAYGQLGDGTYSPRTAPARVFGLPGAVSTSGGTHHTLAVKGDGTVWAWGTNLSGELGDGTNTDRPTPVQTVGLAGAVAAAAGGNHSLALRSDGTVWAWGYNLSGQLGNTSTTASRTPVQAVGLSGAVAVAAGFHHSLALRSDGTVWAWGNNSNGQLGKGDHNDSSTPVQVPGLTGVVAIAAGELHSLALKSDLTVVGWGNNFYGQLGDTTNAERTSPVAVSGLTSATSIGAGTYQSFAVRTDQTGRAWGRNNAYQLGDLSNTDRWSPVTVSGLTGAVAVDGGHNHTFASRNDGTAWGWGDNAYGQLGDGTNSARTSPAVVTGLPAGLLPGVGVDHTTAVLRDGSVLGWGANANGQLGDNSATDRWSPVPPAW